MFDKNGDGMIDQEELETVFSELGKHLSEDEVKVGDGIYDINICQRTRLR